MKLAQSWAFLFASLFLVSQPSPIWAYSTGADPRLTAAPGDSNCTSCHSGTKLNGGGGSVKIILPGDATYTPGTKQHITVQITDSSARRWGFELTARLDSNGSNGAGGTLTATDSTAQVICDRGRAPCAAGVVNFITHTSSGTRNGSSGPISFSFDWTPPATDSGSITLYASGNAANGNGSESGDHIYTTSLQLKSAAAVPVPTISAVNGVSSAASTVAGTAADSWIVIKGTTLSNTTRTWTAAESAAGLPTTLDGVAVMVNNKPAFIQSISPTQVTVLTPSDSTTGAATIQVTNNGTTSAIVSATMTALRPALFTADGHYLATTHGDNPFPGRLDNLPAAGFPAPAIATVGEVISFYGTGFGPVNPAMTDGVLQQTAAAMTTPYTVQIGGENAQVSFAGLAPGFAGIYQFKTTIPSDLQTGDQQVIIQAGTQSTQASSLCCFVQVQAAPVVIPKPVVTGVVSAATAAVTGTAPASWIAINGTNLANSTRTWTVAEASATTGLPTTLDGVSVMVNNLPAFVQAISPTQLIVITPSDTTVGQVNVAVSNNGLNSDPTPATMASIAPVLFTADGKYLVTTHGTDPLDNTRLDVYPATASWPTVTWPAPAAAQPGETISFYGTGFGVLDTPIIDGQLQQNPANIVTPFTITVGGETVTPSFAGLAPGFAGVYQFTVTIPGDLANGDQQVVIQMNNLSTVQTTSCCFVSVQAPPAQ